MREKSLNSLLWVGIMWLFWGCHDGYVRIEERLLPQRNPTTYEFPASIKAVQRAITAARGEDYQMTRPPFQRLVLVWHGDENPFAKNVFSRTNTEYDAYLYGMGEAVGRSSVYVNGGKELLYYAEFQIHLVPAGPQKTRVEILTRDSHVEAGTEWHPFVRAGIYATVAPTSVEEYEILLDVGTQLGVQNMPKIIKPDASSPTRKIKVKRLR